MLANNVFFADSNSVIGSKPVGSRDILNLCSYCSRLSSHVYQSCPTAMVLSFTQHCSHPSQFSDQIVLWVGY